MKSKNLRVVGDDDKGDRIGVLEARVDSLERQMTFVLIACAATLLMVGLSCGIAVKLMG